MHEKTDNYDMYQNINSVAEITLNYSLEADPNTLPKIHSSEHAFTLLHRHWDKNTISLFEMFKIMLLSRNNSVLGMVPISQGGVSGTLVDAKLIFAPALIAGASSIVLCHNHPSGNLKPSRQDIELTKKLAKAGDYLDLKILDHIILTHSKSLYYSMADEGVM